MTKQPTKWLNRTVMIALMLEKYKANFTSTFCSLANIQQSKLIQNAIIEQKKEYVHIIVPSDIKLRRIIDEPVCRTRPFSNLTDISAR